MTLLLPFQRECLQQIAEQDALLLMGRGLGVERVMLYFMLMHATPTSLVVLLNATAEDVDFFNTELVRMSSSSFVSESGNERVSRPLIVNVNSEMTQTDRKSAYLKGGLFAVTSRVLVMDLLLEVIPVQMVTGIVVAHADQFVALFVCLEFTQI